MKVTTMKVRHPNLVINAATCATCGGQVHGRAGCTTCYFTGRTKKSSNSVGRTNNASGEGTPEADWSKAAALASIKSGDARAAGYGKAALACARDGDSDGAEAAHLKCAKRHTILADRALDSNDPSVGGNYMDKGLARQHRKIAALHVKAAAQHATSPDDDDDDDDDATQNVVVRNSGGVGIGDVLVLPRTDYQQVVNQQRRNENKSYARNAKRLSSNARDGGNSPYPQYDLPTTPYGPATAMGRFSPHSFDDGEGDDPAKDSNDGRDGGPMYGGTGRPAYDKDTPNSVRGVPGIQLLDPHEQQAVDAYRAQLLGLDFDPAEAYRLTTPRTMAELLDRERYEGHTQNAAHDPDVMVLNGFDPREAQALQRRTERRKGR